jgi:hypothetical protein
MRYILMAMAGAGALAGCSLGESRGTAENAVGEFHRQLNAGQFHEIYRATAPAFKNATTEERFVGVLATVHDRLGNAGQANQDGWHINYNNGATTVDLNYNTAYARGQAREHFVYLIEGQRASLVRYDINSPVLAGGATTNAPQPPADAKPRGDEGK